MLKTYTKKLLSEIFKSKGFIAIFFVSLLLLVSSIVSPFNNKLEVKQEKVLGASTTPKPSPSPTPSPSVSPSPKSQLVISTPTPTLTPSSTPSQTPTPTPVASTTPTPTSTPTPTPAQTPTPSPSPTPASLTVHIGIDYAGQIQANTYTVSVQPGQTAWDAVVSAIGINNIQFDEYSFGKFITGFNGISADPNSQYYEFRVNGVSSSVGVSDYVLNDGDQLDFVLTSF